MTEEKTADIGELLEKYALSIKRNAHEIPGMPFSVLRQTFAEFADELATLRDRIERDPVVTDAMVIDAMRSAWDDICDDTNCHPLDVVQEGRRKLSFHPNHWVALIAENLRAALVSAPERAEVEPIGYARSVDLDRTERPFKGKTSFWVSENKSAYYNDPVYASPPAPVLTDGLIDALKSIQRYGLDTLSDRTDGPDDRQWQRDAVNEMTKRARIALEAAFASREAT